MAVSLAASEQGSRWALRNAVHVYVTGQCVCHQDVIFIVCFCFLITISGFHKSQIILYYIVALHN